MRKKTAFTLLELLAVMSVISIFVLFATPRLADKAKKAKDVKVMADCGVIESAISIYKTENLNYPTADSISIPILKNHADNNEIITINGRIGGDKILDLDIRVINMDLIKEHVRVKTNGHFYVGDSGVVYFSEKLIN